MSFNQPRADRSDSSQYRRGGRSASFSQKNSNYSASSGKGGGAAAPPQSSNLQPNRSFSKKSYNAQGGQPRAGGYAVNLNSDSNSATASRPAPNGSHLQPPVHAPPVAGSVVKPTTELPVQRSAQVVTNAPSQAPNVKPDPVPHATPTKAPGDASKSFPIQFGSVSPGTLNVRSVSPATSNVMQIPARTSSAPPNLVEQQRDQARRELMRQTPHIPIPTVPKQQVQKKDGGAGDQLQSTEAHQVPKPRKDIQGPSPVPVSQYQRAPPVHNISNVSMPTMPYHHQQVPVQFGGPTPQMQPQGLVGTSLPMPMQMPMQMPMGNAGPQLPHSVYVQGLHPHQMQAQGIMHHGQGMNFPPQMPPQHVSLGMGSGPQFPHLQTTNSVGSRKTVKITHPETHEELKLENASVPRSRQNVPQAQPVTSVPSARPTNYYSNPAYFTAQGSVPLNPSSQPPRLGFPVSQGPATVPSGAPASVQVTIKPATVVHGEKMKDLSSSAPPVEKVLSQKNGEASSIHPHKDLEIRPNSSSNREKPLASVSSASIEEPAPVASHVTENRKKETNIKADSIKDQGKKLTSEGSSQVPGQSTSVPSLASQSLEHTNSFSSKSSETPTPKPPPSSIGSGGVIVESAQKSLPTDSSKISVAKAVDNSATEPLGERTDASTHVELLNNQGAKIDNDSKTPSESAPSKVSELVSQTEISTAVKTSSQKVGSLEVAEKGAEDPLNNCKKDNAEVSSAPLVSDADESISTVTSLASSDGDRNILTTETSVGENESVDSRPAVVAKSVVSDDGVAPVSIVSLPESTSKSEKGAKEKLVAELSKSKSSVGKGKKKGKDFFRKADAAGTTDLYMAYKVPEEKKEIVDDPETKEVVVDSIQDDVELNENIGQGKAEPDDWEDAADNSTPKLEAVDNSNKVSADDGTELMAKKYTRDFLMKFSEQCINLPHGFEIPSDLADALMVTNVNVSRESYPSPGRVVDRSPGGPRRGVVVGDEDRWNRNPNPLVSVRDLRMDMHGGNFRPGQGVNHGGLRSARGQASAQYNTGGILSGPMQSMSSQVGVQRSNSDADRWQRGTGFQKGLIPSPHTPAPVMHKAERKYQVGIITDEEEAKQRQLKSILNKLTPQNFEKLFEQVKAVNIDNAGTLTGVISQIFDKALMEPTFCEMYANFCYHLAGELPDFSEDNEKITFKRLLLNKCQEEFERGEREQEEADRADAEGEVQQSPAEREEKRIQARRRMLGNIRLIGELYKKRMLTERIMHECIKKLLGQYNNPDEEDIESLCKLMSTIGEMIDHPKAKEHMDAYFDMMLRLSNNMKLSSRVRFMLKDAIDLRKNKWQQRRKVEGPKKIEDVHRDAAQERHVQAGRLGRGPGPNSSIRNRQPMEFSSRGSNMLTSPNSQMGGYRGLQSQPRGFGVQDARIDDRHSFESRTPSVPLHHRPLGEESIMLGPQGGLARGMSSRGQPLIANTPLAEAPSSRIGPGLNGFGSAQDRSSAYGTREDLMPRHNITERFSGPYDQGAILDRNTSFGNRTGNRSRPSSPNVGPTPTQNVGSEKVWPEERLREMSLSTIKEFYSAKDEKEVALCVKDLNAPSFYPTMISLWISDSFERKDMERDSLAKLLTNLSKSRDSLLNHDHLIKGFESVLSTLEDAVNDAPKAGEFLGRIFAKIVVEDVIPFPEIGQLIYDGGEEKGSLVEFGLAAEVVGTILEIVKSEKGESFVNDIRTNPGSKLERFRPPNSKKTLRLDKFI